MEGFFVFTSANQVRCRVVKQVGIVRDFIQSAQGNGHGAVVVTLFVKDVRPVHPYFGIVGSEQTGFVVGFGARDKVAGVVLGLGQYIPVQKVTGVELDGFVQKVNGFVEAGLLGHAGADAKPGLVVEPVELGGFAVPADGFFVFLHLLVGRPDAAERFGIGALQPVGFVIGLDGLGVLLKVHVRVAQVEVGRGKGFRQSAWRSRRLEWLPRTAPICCAQCPDCTRRAASRGLRR